MQTISKHKHHLVLLLVLALTFSGCSSKGFNRGALRAEMNGIVMVTDADIQKALAAKPQLPKPFKLGVYFRLPTVSGGYHTDSWNWTDQDKEKLLSSAEKLKATGQISDIFIISDATVSSVDLKSLRLAAARHGADALLIVDGINDLDSYSNSWGWTYLALVTAFFVPATVTDSLFMAKAAMWDVRNEFLYLTAEAEQTRRQTKPLALTEARKLTNETKADAVDKLRQEILKMFDALGGKRD